MTQADIYAEVPRYGKQPAFDRHLQGAVINGTVYRDTAYFRTTSIRTAALQTATVQAPNPFTESMMLDYDLQQAATVEAVITSADGKPVATLRQGLQSAGKQMLQWNGKSADGASAAPGTYFISLRINEHRAADVKVIKVK